VTNNEVRKPLQEVLQSSGVKYAGCRDASQAPPMVQHSTSMRLFRNENNLHTASARSSNVASGAVRAAFLFAPGRAEPLRLHRATSLLEQTKNRLSELAIAPLLTHGRRMRRCVAHSGPTLLVR
jgi:hypothetical protein